MSEEIVTNEQIQIMYKYSKVFYGLIILGLVLAFFEIKGPFAFSNRMILSTTIIPFILALWTLVYTGIRHKVIGSIGFSYPTYHGKRAQIMGILFFVLTVYMLYSVIIQPTSTDNVDINEKEDGTMSVRLIFGIVFLVLGIGSLVAKLFNFKGAFWKLEAFEKNYGKKWGTIFHTIGYVVVPIIIGLYMILSELGYLP